jgi:hypothetical protein
MPANSWRFRNSSNSNSFLIIERIASLSEGGACASLSTGSCFTGRSCTGGVGEGSFSMLISTSAVGSSTCSWICSFSGKTKVSSLKDISIKERSKD